jgi:hypothetical protein
MTPMDSCFLARIDHHPPTGLPEGRGFSGWEKLVGFPRPERARKTSNFFRSLFSRALPDPW